jgi:hypothetical protein
MPPSSGSKNKQNKIQHEADSKQCLFADCFMLGLLFDPEDGGDIFLRNIG